MSKFIYWFLYLYFFSFLVVLFSSDVIVLHRFVLFSIVNDKVSLRFFYNLGIEYFKFLQQVHGYGGVMAMIDGDNVSGGYEPTPSVASDVDSTVQHQQLANDFQQLNFDSNEIETQSPSKVIY